MSTPNSQIRLLARIHNIPLWKLANELKISEATLGRRLRFELSKEDEKKYKEAILAISNQKI